MEMTAVRMPNNGPHAPHESCGADLPRLLEHERAAIVGSAFESIRSSCTHYQGAGSYEVRRRIETLFDQMLAAIKTRDLGGIIQFARVLAAERFRSGYDLSEVQSAINALEEATWTTLCARLEPGEHAVALGLVSTVLGAAKGALAREYVSLALQTRVPSLDMRALFSGDAGAGLGDLGAP